jgi:hypothetical protein
LGHLFSGERDDHALWLFESQTGGGRSRSAEAQWAARPVNAFAEPILAGDLRLVMEAVKATDRDQAVIHGLRCGLGLLVELVSNIVEQQALVQLGE